MIETNWLAIGLLRLGDRSVKKLRKCVIIVAGSSAVYEIEVLILENNPRGLERAANERVEGNKNNKRLR